MEAYHGRNNDPEESTHLLSEQVAKEDVKKKLNGRKSKEATADVVASPEVCAGDGFGWIVNGLPLGHVVGEPMGRSQWNSFLFACCGRNDKFCSSDIEVCLLGSMVPCVLYGSNVERLESAPGTFTHHCLTYSGLYLVGNTLFGWNCLAPWFSRRNRVAVRRKFNLEAIKLPKFCLEIRYCYEPNLVLVLLIHGTFEALNRSCGCCGSCVENEVRREQCESAWDFATHFFCHICALCQEGRELRRRLPHPGLDSQPIPGSVDVTRLWVVDPNYMLLPLRTDSKV
ncbi:hypothetical protein ES288_A11G390200v1 [Gossypium darwinii]|uniref:PLAC8 family protein n=1 Tax=Gossypium darwinii TaxID=34276 RepID=A0A5D2ETH6_GOSDA|nr:hypothetical protein ES288_A11G390200v1 [Gossypium darwinii]